MQWSKKEVTLKMMQFSYDSFSKEVMGGLSVIEFSDKQGEEDPWSLLDSNKLALRLLLMLTLTCPR